jgi:hypothetical protein
VQQLPSGRIRVGQPGLDGAVQLVIDQQAEAALMTTH